MQVRTLLHRQGGRCFYCRQRLGIKDATIEHIIPSCMGQYEGFTNLVACCALMNSTLQGLPPKHKIEILLNWAGDCPCPKAIGRKVHAGECGYLGTSFNDPVYGWNRSRSNQPLSIDLPDDFKL